MSSSTCSLIAVTKSVFFPPFLLAAPARHGRRELLGAGTGHLLPPLVGFLSESGRAGRSRPPAADVPPGAMASSSAVESAVPTHAIPGLLQKSGKVGNLADFCGFSAEQKWEMVFPVSHFASPDMADFCGISHFPTFFWGAPD